MTIISHAKTKLLRKFEKPIFVVGCGNSGTTILWKTLLSHADLGGPLSEGQDLKDLPRCMTHFLGRQTFRLFAHSRFKMAYRTTEKDYTPRIGEHLAEVYADHLSPGLRFIEKSPSNSMRVRFLQRVFPDAFFVLVVRNGIAVSEGIRRKRWYDPDRQPMAGLQTTIADAAEHWSRTNHSLFLDRLHLRRSIVVRYEDLVANPAPVLHAILEFCECAPAPLCLPEFETAFNDTQIQRLTVAELAMVRRVAGPTLAALGY
jgi:Sulfotransferase family